MVRAVHLRVLPQTRGECVDGPRPCPLVTCRHHLLLDVSEDGRLLSSRAIDESDADSITSALASMPDTCALDVASRGGAGTSEIATALGIEVGGRMGISEQIRRALKRISESSSEADFDEREHPEDFYIRYSNMGADELADLAAELRRRSKGR